MKSEFNRTSVRRNDAKLKGKCWLPKEINGGNFLCEHGRAHDNNDSSQNVPKPLKPLQERGNTTANCAIFVWQINKLCQP